MKGSSQLLGGLEVHITGSMGMSHKINTKSTMHKGQMYEKDLKMVKVNYERHIVVNFGFEILLF